MSKVKVKAITRWQKFLAAIAGDAVAPNPVTDREKLMYNIAEKVNEGGTGGGVLVITETVSGNDSTLSATYKQIADAGFCVLDVEAGVGLHTLSPLSRYAYAEGLGYGVGFLGDGKLYIAETENDYPVYHDDK